PSNNRLEPRIETFPEVAACHPSISSVGWAWFRIAFHPPGGYNTSRSPTTSAVGGTFTLPGSGGSSSCVAVGLQFSECIATIATSTKKKITSRYLRIVDSNVLKAAQ